LHRGTITIDSTPGKGTCVTITLPRQPADADAAAA
jgi:signal transduction histidine kinase